MKHELEKLSKAQLIDIIIEQAKLLEQQARTIENLLKRIKELERNAARSATPFSKGKGKSRKKKPGRKAGKGPFRNRAAPKAKPSDIVENLKAPLESAECPGCGATMDVEVEEASSIDVPEEPQRLIKRFEVEVGTCPECGRKVRGTHHDLPRDQCGATAHRVGDIVAAQAFAMHYHGGMTLRKASEAIGIMTGITITQGGLTLKTSQLCKREGVLGKVYEGLRGEIRESPVVNTDDTGWRTGGKPSYLMGFFTPTLAVYQIRDRHRHEEVLEMIGGLFAGILGTDRGTSYEAGALLEMRQQKCLSHLLKNLSMVEEMKRGRAKEFSSKLKKILRSGLKLWQDHRSDRIGDAAYKRRGEKLQEELDYHLRNRELSDADNQRMLDGIGRQNDKGRVLLFLEHPEVEPTNNCAERGLRPAVIARKVSQCSKNATGTMIYETMKSITATLVLRGQNVATGLAGLMRGGEMPSA